VFIKNCTGKSRKMTWSTYFLIIRYQLNVKIIKYDEHPKEIQIELRMRRNLLKILNFTTVDFKIMTSFLIAQDIKRVFKG
jgi:hypothetical protein